MRWGIGLLFYCACGAAAIVSTPTLAQDWSCVRKPTCGQMRSCAEADFYLRQCGHRERDGDGDGIPCEALCGSTMEIYQLRRVQRLGQSVPHPEVAALFGSDAG